MESRRPPGTNTARIVTILLVLVGCCLFGCGGGEQANSPATGAHYVQLNWERSTAIEVLGYNVYRGTQSGGPYVRLNPAPLANPDYLDTAVLSGQTFYYVVTASSAVMESAPSAEAVAVIP